jgi:hypothetical protein
MLNVSPQPRNVRPVHRKTLKLLLRIWAGEYSGTLHLDEGRVRFHLGEPLTAEDLRKSVRALDAVDASEPRLRPAQRVGSAPRPGHGTRHVEGRLALRAAAAGLLGSTGPHPGGQAPGGLSGIATHPSIPRGRLGARRPHPAQQRRPRRGKARARSPCGRRRLQGPQGPRSGTQGPTRTGAAAARDQPPQGCGLLDRAGYPRQDEAGPRRRPIGAPLQPPS